MAEVKGDGGGAGGSDLALAEKGLVRRAGPLRQERPPAPLQPRPRQGPRPPPRRPVRRLRVPRHPPLPRRGLPRHAATPSRRVRPLRARAGAVLGGVRRLRPRLLQAAVDGAGRRGGRRGRRWWACSGRWTRSSAGASSSVGRRSGTWTSRWRRSRRGCACTSATAGSAWRSARGWRRGRRRARGGRAWPPTCTRPTNHWCSGSDEMLAI
uniref:Uncharacterized protein n=1 Tax=Arundo donax TaxID=35708 RepID=A0A0A8Y7H0_ARUDO